VSSGYIPREITNVVGNPTKAGGFWEVAGKNGVQCVVIDAAMAWDRPEVPNVKLLAGLGVPDVRGANGDWFIYTTSDTQIRRAPEGQTTNTAGRIFRVDERDGRIESFVYGPQNYWLIDRARAELRSIRDQLGKPGLTDVKVDRLRARSNEILQDVLPRLECRKQYDRSEEGRSNLPLVVEKRPGKTIVTIGGQAQEIQEGKWSNWYHLTFELNPLVKVKAITRCKLVRRDDPFELYVDILQIDPSDPMFWQPISQPKGFAAELEKSIREPYETVGWACLTMPLKDREIDPVTFMQDIELTRKGREKLLKAALARNDWRALVVIESTPDRVQHMMYQYSDPEHPLYDASKAAQKLEYSGQKIALSDAIAATYREMDRLVGEVMRELRPGDTLLLCADHGFQTFRRQVSLNNWLAREGYLVLRDDVTLDDSGGLLYVDWSRTRAYAVGLGMIFLNMEGRERDGIVSAAEKPALLEEIKAKLLALEDPDLKQRVVRNVYEIARIHSGEYVGDEADLMVGFEATWRVAWSSTLGNIALTEGENGGVVPGPIFSANKSTWSGDHVSVSEDLVQGIFFANRKVEIPTAGIDLLHVAPTALSILGVPVPPEYDRPPLRFVP
jgi:predicted AlkP superfamily phosphohydrolase/phosphomutase